MGPPDPFSVYLADLGLDTPDPGRSDTGGLPSGQIQSTILKATGLPLVFCMAGMKVPPMKCWSMAVASCCSSWVLMSAGGRSRGTPLGWLLLLASALVIQSAAAALLLPLLLLRPLLPLLLPGLLLPPLLLPLLLLKQLLTLLLLLPPPALACCTTLHQRTCL